MKAISPGDQINILFEMVLDANGKPYTITDVSLAAGISVGVLSLLRNNRNCNPTFATLSGISKFFGVSLDYFNCQTQDECRLYIENPANRTPPNYENMPSPIARQIFSKALGMSDYGRRELLRMAEVVETADRAMQDNQHSASV